MRKYLLKLSIYKSICFKLYVKEKPRFEIRRKDCNKAMTIEEIHEKLKAPEYDFLRNNQHLGSNIILLGLGGSYSYGMNIEGKSDIDIRGVALNSKEEILLLQNFGQVVEANTDTTIYSFNKMIELLCKANPNVMEQLGLKPEHYLYLHPIGQELLKNSQLFLSK